MTSLVELNGITYKHKGRPIVVVCIDGGDPTYFEHGIASGILPNVERFQQTGFGVVAEGSMPSLTNPNNMSIVTGSPPSVHGISGNYFLDPDTGDAVMMNDPVHLRSDTILECFSRAGERVVAITAKDKLRRLLGRGLDFARGSMAFSAEKSDQCSVESNGIANVVDLVGLPVPNVYSADLSLFVLEAGIKILERDRPSVMYLSLTDYIQHKFGPNTPEINHLYSQLDLAFGQLVDLGATVAITADHGMSHKSNPDGSPNVLYLQDELDSRLGPTTTRVILPITDPYVVHHGALGGFARIYCNDNVSTSDVIDIVRDLPGIEAVYDKATVCEKFDLPPDREGDVVVISDAATAIGGAEAEHDLSELQGFSLRSHGGLAERFVPMIISEPLSPAYLARAESGVKSYEVFDYAINGVAN
tara:strand:- start:11 stop:1261 length:1251 start_codon:yes stop_codon:yes gene_type:complete